jgi:isoleucyl-tRNA synthetase
MDFKQQATAIFEKYLSEWESNPQRMESGYDYEATYADMMQKIEHEVLQLSVGAVPRDKNVKKNSKPDLAR